jgi:hypothetical protein|tara:strand:+ start:994 stop:1218 length:225 start_codon:yes stop_codon:yes gene_type:complete
MQSTRLGIKMSWKDSGYGVSYSRGIPYYELKEMKASVGRCHKLFKKELPAFDTMYFLKIMDYGQLQRNYKCGYG